MTAIAFVLLLAADPQPVNPKANAEAFITAMTKGEFEAATRDFDAKVAEKMPPEKVRELWANIIEKIGAFERVTGTRSEARTDHHLVYVAAKYAKATIEFRVVVDKAGKIVGISIGNPPVPYTYPEYVNADTFEESQIVVGRGTPWELPGTLTKPKGTSPVAGIVLVHGSGPHDRDETIQSNKPFKDLAAGLASRGVAVLRYDKRTLVHRGKVVPENTTIDAEVTDDARAALALLRKTPGIDPLKVYVLGHSLGAMMAPKIASLEPTLAGFIILAGPTRPLEDVILDQFAYLASLPNLGEGIKTQEALVKQQVARVKNPKLDPNTPPSELPLGAPAAYWLSLRGYSPAAVAQKLSCRILVVHGDRDYQVTETDFAGWERALFSKPSATLKRFADLNHLFVTGKGKATPSEYEKPGHVAREVIELIADWAK